MIEIPMSLIDLDKETDDLYPGHKGIRGKKPIIPLFVRSNGRFLVVGSVREYRFAKIQKMPSVYAVLMTRDGHQIPASAKLIDDGGTWLIPRSE